MKPKLKIENDRAVINGALTIKHHKEVLHLLQKVADANIPVVVFDHPADLDLSSVQMIWSLYTTKKNTSSPVRLVFNLNEPDYKLLQRCGFSFLLTSTHL